MRHFLLRQDQLPDAWEAMFVEGISLQALRVGLPTRLPATLPRVTLSPAGRAPSDFLESPCPIVSDAMRAVLDAAGVDNVEYIRADVDFAYSDGTVVGSCWLANVVGAVSCAEPLSAEAVRERVARRRAGTLARLRDQPRARPRLSPVPPRGKSGFARRQCARRRRPPPCRSARSLPASSRGLQRSSGEYGRDERRGRRRSGIPRVTAAEAAFAHPVTRGIVPTAGAVLALATNEYPARRHNSACTDWEETFGPKLQQLRHD